MNKDKHVLPDDNDTFIDRFKREVRKQNKKGEVKNILGPDNKILSKVKVKR